MRRFPRSALFFLALVAAACTPVTKNTAAPRAGDSTQSGGLPAVGITLAHVANLPGAIVMADRPNDQDLYVGTRDGVVHRISHKNVVSTVLDFHTRVLNNGEQGFLGMTFSPDGTKLYVHYSASSSTGIAHAGDTEVDEYAYANGAVNPATRRTVLTQSQPQTNHNGGSLLFGPDNMLYLALGDGGGGNDGFPNYSGNNHDVPHGNGQSLTTKLGKILRLDPTDPDGGGPATYTIPPTNPFFGDVGKEQLIWSYGLRNPFRISFDKTTGDLWVADVGQSLREEVDWVTHGDATTPYGKQANFGWNRFEGDINGPDTNPSPNPGTFVGPIFAIDHSAGDCAIIGGYVYRGTRIPDLQGSYVFSDNCNPQVRAFTPGHPATGLRVLANGPSAIASFGQDNNGELYVLSLASGVYRIDDAVGFVPRNP